MIWKNLLQITSNLGLIKIYQTILALIWIAVIRSHKQTHHVTIILLFDFQGWKPLCRSFSTIQQPHSTSFWLYGLLISTMPFAALRQSLSVIGWGKCFFKLFTHYKSRIIIKRYLTHFYSTVHIFLSTITQNTVCIVKFSPAFYCMYLIRAHTILKKETNRFPKVFQYLYILCFRITETIDIHLRQVDYHKNIE